MMNIFQLKKSLEQLQNNSRFTEPQRQFFKILLEGQSGESGWRSFSEIAKSPIIESKIDRLCAAIQIEYERTPTWNLISRQKLRKLRQKITDDRTDEEKINWIRKKNLPFDSIKKELAVKFSASANHGNDIDHLIDALKKKISQTSWSDLTYLRTLRRLHAQLTTFKTSQIQRWILIQQNKHRIKRDDLLCEETVTRFHGTILLPVKQKFDYRLGSSGGECAGYVRVWGQALLKDKSFCGVVSSDQTPLFKHVKYASAIGQRYPELNHGAILTEEISNAQHGDDEPLGISDTPINFLSFFHSIDKLAEKLVTTIDSNPKHVLLLRLMHYSAGHEVGLCKQDGNYHFFDANLGWVRFNQAHDFQTWFPFYFKTLGYSSKTIEYKDMFHESWMGLMKYDPTVTQQSEAPPPSNPLSCYSKMACLLLTFSPCVASLAIYYIGIRGLIYKGLYLSAKIKNACQTSDSFEVPLTESMAHQHSVDDWELSFFNRITHYVKPSISHHFLAGTLFTTERDRPRDASNVIEPAMELTMNGV